jgi:hypothetical protein
MLWGGLLFVAGVCDSFSADRNPPVDRLAIAGGILVFIFGKLNVWWSNG